MRLVACVVLACMIAPTAMADGFFEPKRATPLRERKPPAATTSTPTQPLRAATPAAPTTAAETAPPATVASPPIATVAAAPPGFVRDSGCGMYGGSGFRRLSTGQCTAKINTSCSRDPSKCAFEGVQPQPRATPSRAKSAEPN